MQPTLLEQGVMLMLVGMGTVFVFLTLLVAAMSLMGAAVRRFQPVEEPGGPTDEEVAAITAAIARHRESNYSP